MDEDEDVMAAVRVDILITFPRLLLLYGIWSKLNFWA